MWVDQNDEHKYVPLWNVEHGHFEVLDSPLSEYGVLGFEYGYALADPKTLVLWEAQFGDFVNGAQIMIDQFIASGEAKWLRANGLVMLLPHGYEGRGRSIRRRGRSASCNSARATTCRSRICTTPANYFHLLCCQIAPQLPQAAGRHDTKLLPRKMAVSSAADFQGDTHFRRILSDPKGAADAATKRVVLCTGKVAYDLMEARDAAGDTDTQIVRVEQLYPFPTEALAARIAKMPALEHVVWAQEEPRSNGDGFLRRAADRGGARHRERIGEAPALRRPRRRRLPRDRVDEAPPGRAGRADRRCARPQRAPGIRRTREAETGQEGRQGRELSCAFPSTPAQAGVQLEGHRC
ncbi:hypothetical protein AB5I41_15160 [Sphingomonas sp. MMS24-JH45]